VSGAPLPLCQSGVVGLQTRGECQIVYGVFVPAIHAGFVGQRGQPFKRGLHLRRIALEQPPAATGEQRISGEHRRLGPEIIGNMTACMSGDEQCSASQSRQREGFAVLEWVGDAGYPLAVTRIAEYADMLGAKLGDEIEIPTDVVEMVMRRQDGDNANILGGGGR